MLWLKNHPHMIYSLCFVFAVSFLSLFGFVSNSSATSQSFTYNFDDMPAQEVVDSSILGFTPVYVEVELSGSSFVNSYGAVGKVFYDSTSSYHTYCYFDSTGYCHFVEYLPVGKFQRNGKWSYSNTPGFTSLTITYYDTNPLVPCSCPTCPEVPENPYDDKLDKIYNAIIIGSATMLVIYFFYVMYSWYMGGRS